MAENLESTRRRRVFVRPDELEGDAVRFSADNRRYLQKVLRLKDGDRVEAFNGVEVFVVELCGGREDSLYGKIESRLVASEAEEPFITLAFGCVRPGPLGEILRHGTELGVGLFVPLITRRTTRKPELASPRWDKIIRAAVAQSGRTTIPPAQDPMDLDSFVHCDWTNHAKLLLSTAKRACPILSYLKREELSSAVILVGPEGGLDQEEETAVTHAGFEPVSLGAATLRAETAALAAVSAVVLWHESSDMRKRPGKALANGVETAPYESPTHRGDEL